MSERPKETRCKRVGTAYAGSNPAPPIRPTGRYNADVAQPVEHLHGKEGVRGSSPLVGFRLSEPDHLRPDVVFEAIVIRRHAGRLRSSRRGTRVLHADLRSHSLGGVPG